MTIPDVRIGFDRFLAKKWADQALNLFSSPGDGDYKYSYLKEWLSQEIIGKDAARKTANQLKRLWLNPADDYQVLRNAILTEELTNNYQNFSIFHYGMAINVFPIFRDVCGYVGKLSKLQGQCSSWEIKDRIMEKYGSPLSTPRITDRILQTLYDWKIISHTNNSIRLTDIEIENREVSQWFLLALLFTSPTKSMQMEDLTGSSLKLGILTKEVRDLVGLGTIFQFHRDATNHEVVTVSRN